MKKLLLLLAFLFLGFSQPTHAQFLKKIKDKLDKPLIKKKDKKISDEELERRNNIKLPDAGALDKDEALKSIAIKGLDEYYEKYSMSNTHQYITSDTWSTVKHKDTGVPLYQWAVGAVVQKNSDGQCMLYEFILRKDYTGGGDYGKAYFNGINRATIKAPYGNYVGCVD
ncbi:hypothetical protein BWZ20_00925 [Winogradskyella sp. J14-2]|uniref:hypothetical protein n=1 Tax=Winogradskyella sp. J14-2 TaxID=1936080 RepID=UPI000972C3B6|nr:hypothetical protein [Winogradskyella sp. J14-2]APY06946.1 hypothetical protein BWZ20_00925 [Winogradskyella sp. J14-2]